MSESSVKKLSVCVLKLKLTLYLEGNKGFDVLFVLTVCCNFPIFMDFHSAFYFSSHSLFSSVSDQIAITQYRRQGLAVPL